MFFLIQRSVLYPGARLGPGPSWSGTRGPAPPVERIELVGAAGPVEALFVPAIRSGGDRPGVHPETDRPGAVAIVFHGNAELAIDLVRPFEPLARLGVAALFVEYPGFGGRPGRPSERSIGAAAMAAYDWLAARPDVDAARIIAIGRSLGTGPAAALSLERELSALVLWSPFVSIGHLATRKYGLPSFLAKDRFDSKTAVAAFDGPILLFHGRHDRVIPPSNGEILARASRDGRLVSWDCGHNDCPPVWSDLWDPLGAFLREHDLSGP